MRRASGVLALVASAVIAASCGGSADQAATTTSSTVAAVPPVVDAAAGVTEAAAVPPETAPPETAPPTLTRDEYVAAADALCLDFVRQADALPEPQTPEELAQLLASALSLGEATSAAFAALLPPPEAAEVHAALRSSLDGSLVYVRQAQAAVAAGDYEAADVAIEQATVVGEQSDEVAIGFGMQVCGSEDQYYSQ